METSEENDAATSTTAAEAAIIQTEPVDKTPINLERPSTLEPVEASSSSNDVVEPSVEKVEVVEASDMTHELEQTEEGLLSEEQPALPSPAISIHEEIIEAPVETPLDEHAITHTIKAFLLTKIQQNQCATHTQEIYEFIEAQLPKENDRLRLMPRILQHLSAQFPLTGSDELTALELQTSLHHLEQLFIPFSGRASPFEAMYTTEEAAMLELLANGSNSNTTTPRIV